MLRRSVALIGNAESDDNYLRFHHYDPFHLTHPTADIKYLLEQL